MDNLPTGTVTFWFTDVGGSTALWEEDPEGMRQAMRQHDALVERVVEAHGGQLVKPRGEGDSHFVVFTRASDAVAAACALQQALDAESWPLPVPLRVRMALHTGEADLRAGDYYGPDVNRCARLRGLAHPGQVLLSLATVRLTRESLPEGVALRDLGQHRLKDLTEPEHVFQLVVPGLEADFPPVLSLESRPNNLPVMPTPLIGREQELATLTELLQRETIRLVTVTGPGGVGKTRLSLQVAAELLDDFADGIFFVALAPISDPSLVAATIAETLHIQEQGAETLREALKAHLRDKSLLLVLDNFEQVIEAAPLVAELLAACPCLKVLVTSREALRVRGEQEFPLPHLALPDPAELPRGDEELVDALSHYAAVELFVERAQAVKPGFTLTPDNALAIVEICRHLDGLPLAIELAAARAKLFTPQSLKARLTKATGSALHLLTSGARDLPERHQALRDTIEWSYTLLDPSEQLLFRRLAVFVDGLTLQAAEAVCNRDGDLELEVLDGLASLLDKSLLRQTKQGDSKLRFFLLQTIQEYALERLEGSGEEAAIREAHATYYLTLMEEAAPQLMADTIRPAWLRRLEAEYDNLRAALNWTMESGDPTVVVVQAEEGFGDLVLTRAHYREALDHYQNALQALDQIHLENESEVRARLHRKRALVYEHLGAFENAFDTLEVGLRIVPKESIEKAALYLMGAGLYYRQGRYREALAWCDKALQVDALPGVHPVRAHGEKLKGTIMYTYLAQPTEALEPLNLALKIYTELEDLPGQADTSSNLGVAYLTRASKGDWERAKAFFKRDLTLAKRMNDRNRQARGYANLGWIAYCLGDSDSAIESFKMSLSIWGENDARLMCAIIQTNLGAVELARGDYQAAEETLQSAIETLTDLDARGHLAEAYRYLALVHLSEGDRVAAYKEAKQALRLARESEATIDEAAAQRVLGQIALSADALVPAAEALSESYRLLNSISNRYELAQTLVPLSEVHRREGDSAKAEALVTEAATIFEELGAVRDLARTRQLNRTKLPE